jgi:HPt (histidine-containing phosphotransfer) domain-containing protein
MVSFVMNILLFCGTFKTRMNSNLKSINLDHLNSIAGGDESFARELIGIFLTQIPVFINNMKTYFSQNKFENLAREAHTAKSSALIFGMENTGRLLKEIQHLAENKMALEIAPALKEVETELCKAEVELKDVMKV